jgi:CRP-like cAMP-binding protein
MIELSSILSSELTILPQDESLILSNFENRAVKKNQILLEAGKRCTEMYFVKSGYLRVYSLSNGMETTLWIAGGGAFITSLSSFIFEMPNNWYIQTVTYCELEVISRQDHFDLLKECPKWMEFDIILLSKSFAMLEERMFHQLYTNSTERLQKLQSNNPDLFKHVPLQYIASSLGITPETLSRIRKKVNLIS